MPLFIFLTHSFFAVTLFFLVNWIGKHSYGLGYRHISVFVKTEEAPAFNFVLRVLTPIVYIIVVSALLYAMRADRIVHRIYLVNIYYILIRLAINLITERAGLINWKRQLFYWIPILIGSYLVYDRIIRHKANLLPDFTSISNELWIIVMIFLFQVLNSVKVDPSGQEDRRTKYIQTQYEYFSQKFGLIIRQYSPDRLEELIIFSIIIYENFNRPKIARTIENINHRLSNRSHSLGVMQVQSDSLLSDEDSIKLGTQKVIEAHRKYNTSNPLKSDEPRSYQEYLAMTAVIADYNGGTKYNEGISEVASVLENLYYPTPPDPIATIEE